MAHTTYQIRLETLETVAGNTEEIAQEKIHGGSGYPQLLLVTETHKKNEIVSSTKTIKYGDIHFTLEEQIEEAKMYIRAVATGQEEMQLICSSPGLGKSYLTTQELKKCGIEVSCQNPDNVYAFVQSLWEYRKKPVIVFDDCEKLLRNEAIANIAKQAFGPTRQVVHITKKALENEQLLKKDRDEDEDDFQARRRRYDSNIPRTQFRINCRLIMLSNIDWTKEENVSEKMLVHFRALESRGLDPIWIDSSDDKELFLYTLNLAPRMASDYGVSLSKTQRLIDWLISHRNHLREITPRTVFRLVKKFKNFDETVTSIRSMLMPTRQRSIPEIVPPRFIRQNEWTKATLKVGEAPIPKPVAKPVVAAKKPVTAAKKVPTTKRKAPAKSKGFKKRITKL